LARDIASLYAFSATCTSQRTAAALFSDGGRLEIRMPLKERTACPQRDYVA